MWLIPYLSSDILTTKNKQKSLKRKIWFFLIHQNKIEVGLVQVSSFWNFNNYLWNSILQCVKFGELMSFSALSKSRFGVGTDDYCLYCWSHKTADEVITVYRSDLKKNQLDFHDILLTLYCKSSIFSFVWPSWKEHRFFSDQRIRL